MGGGCWEEGEIVTLDWLFGCVVWCVVKFCAGREVVGRDWVVGVVVGWYIISVCCTSSQILEGCICPHASVAYWEARIYGSFCSVFFIEGSLGGK